MNYQNFMEKLFTVNKRVTIVSEIDLIKETISSKTMPILDFAEKWMTRNSKIVTDETKELLKLMTKQGIRGNPFTSIKKSVNNCIEVLDYIEETLDANDLVEDITSASLTLKMVTALKLINVVSFISDWSRRFCYLIITYEYNRTTGRDISDGVTKEYLTTFNDYKYTFAQGIVKFGVPFKQIKQELDGLVDVMVTPGNYDTIISTFGHKKVDPLQLNFFSPKYNPVFFIGKQIARYQANKYEQAKIEIHEIQCKLLKLKQENDGVGNAKLEKQIEFYNNQNTRLQAQLSEMEEEYGLS